MLTASYNGLCNLIKGNKCVLCEVSSFITYFPEVIAAASLKTAFRAHRGCQEFKSENFNKVTYLPRKCYLDVINEIYILEYW